MAGSNEDVKLRLSGFSLRRPRYRVAQEASLDWLAQVHAVAQATISRFGPLEQTEFAQRLRKVLDRCACGPHQIAERGHVVPDVAGDASNGAIYDVSHDPRGSDAGERARVFDAVVSDYFVDEYAAETDAPDDLIHVTCTGYVAPSGAQKLVSQRGWGAQTRVTHAYHMGCYASLPATRMAVGFLRSPSSLRTRSADIKREPRVDVVHTELCSLHLDPHDHSIEQLVVQSLFADGFVRYAISRSPARGRDGLEVLAFHEEILDDSVASMRWSTSSANLRMTLSRDVPDRISAALCPFVERLYLQAGLRIEDCATESAFAVHPGGPKIIDRVSAALNLREWQVSASRQVLLEHGNMSSATLPHVWARLCNDDAVRGGTLIVSLAFGPGLTVSGAIFRKLA